MLQCIEKGINESSEPRVLLPMLDEICGGHHGGYHRGKGLELSRRRPNCSGESSASFKRVSQLEHELQDTRKELTDQLQESQAENRILREKMDGIEALLIHTWDGVSLPNNDA